MEELSQELRKLSKEIRKLKHEDENKYFTRYFEELFPTVFEIVQQRMETKYTETFSKIREKYFGLMQTVGDSPEPLLLSILLLRPKKVLLIHTFETEKHAERLIHQVHLWLGEDVPSINKKQVDGSKTVEVYQAVKEQWEVWSRDGKTIAIDVTGGKKSMTSGASLAVGTLNVDIVYVDNEGYDSQERRPIDGAEFIGLLPNPMEVFGDIEKAKAIELFKENNYSGAAIMFGKLYKVVPLDEFGYNAYQLLSEAYECWDSFEIEKAYGKIKNLCEKLELQIKFGKTYPLTNYLKTLQTQRTILERLKQIIKDANTLKNTGFFIPQDIDKTITLIFSLYKNALRREQQAKYDMAVLLLYRILEMIEQRRLAIHGIDTANPKYPEDREEELHKDFSACWKDLLSKLSKKNNVLKEPQDKQLPSKITLVDGYVLLAIFRDALTKSVALTKIHQQANARNKSIFAHGFQAMSKGDYNALKKVVDETLQTFCEIEGLEREKLLKDYEFIQPFTEQNT